LLISYELMSNEKIRKSNISKLTNKIKLINYARIHSLLIN